MSEKLRCSFVSGWSTVYFLLRSGDKNLNRVTLTLDTYSAGSIASYRVTATEVGSTGIYESDVPAGSPAAKYDVFPYRTEENGGSPAESDPAAAGGFSIQWNGNTVVDEVGDDVDATVALVTLTEAKQYLKETGTDKDAIIAALINSVSKWACNYVGRNLLSATRTEYYTGDGTPELLLSNYPIVSVTSVYEDANRDFGSDTAEDVAADIVIEKDAGILRAWNDKGYWAGGYAGIKVTYVAGYTAGPSGTMPHDLKLAVYRILDHQYRTGYTHRKLDVSSETASDQTTTYEQDAIPKDAKAILDGYKKPIMSGQFVYGE